MPTTELHSTTPELDPRLTSLAEGFAALTEDIDALVAQRDELLASVRDFVTLYAGTHDLLSQSVRAKVDRARAALAKADGVK